MARHRLVVGFQLVGPAICALIVAVCILLMDGQGAWPARMKFFAVAMPAAVAAFVLERFSAFELFSGGAPFGFTLHVVLAFALGAALVPTVFPYSSNRWLNPTHWHARIYLVAALLLVLPLSFATIRLLPAVNGSTDAIHAIKMGYPVFWTALLVPLALWLGRKANATPPSA